jgi:hypothetical protein
VLKGDALAGQIALMTDPQLWPAETVASLKPLLERFL